MLCRHDLSKAVDVLVKDLKVFSSFNEELFKEITQLLTLENFRYLFGHYLLTIIVTEIEDCSLNVA